MFTNTSDVCLSSSSKIQSIFVCLFVLTGNVEIKWGKNPKRDRENQTKIDRFIYLFRNIFILKIKAKVRERERDCGEKWSTSFQNQRTFTFNYDDHFISFHLAY